MRSFNYDFFFNCYNHVYFLAPLLLDINYLNLNTLQWQESRGHIVVHFSVEPPTCPSSHFSVVPQSYIVSVDWESLSTEVLPFTWRNIWHM